MAVFDVNKQKHQFYSGLSVQFENFNVDVMHNIDTVLDSLSRGIWAENREFTFEAVSILS